MDIQGGSTGRASEVGRKMWEALGHAGKDPLISVREGVGCFGGGIGRPRRRPGWAGIAQQGGESFTTGFVFRCALQESIHVGLATVIVVVLYPGTEGLLICDARGSRKHSP